ncbi:ubiquitin-like protein Pup [Nesterenkonia sp. HG001]|uniref:ubiquitin-like protein Pup n=1 Tax=Nesterenkonia sp. HG001 TaxID=2983207 RepID=UPI002AC39325|nr:ubiquitin-like protein Pup [Nesterenkonia sp. HG001]MDZ5077979.1 ubiquitin-like protein Pup [Nesterenkonia sp. HG001]
MPSQPQRRPGESAQDRPTVPDDGAAAPVPTGGSAQSQGRAEELDSLLDEIDSVLETNAEEFVKGFVQKGGQ